MSHTTTRTAKGPNDENTKKKTRHSLSCGSCAASAGRSAGAVLQAHAHSIILWHCNSDLIAANACRAHLPISKCTISSSHSRPKRRTNDPLLYKPEGPQRQIVRPRPTPQISLARPKARKQPEPSRSNPDPKPACNIC